MTNESALCWVKFIATWSPAHYIAIDKQGIFIGWMFAICCYCFVFLTQFVCVSESIHFRHNVQVHWSLSLSCCFFLLIYIGKRRQSVQLSSLRIASYTVEHCILCMCIDASNKAANPKRFVRTPWVYSPCTLHTHWERVGYWKPNTQHTDSCCCIA